MIGRFLILISPYPDGLCGDEARFRDKFMFTRRGSDYPDGASISHWSALTRRDLGVPHVRFFYEGATVSFLRRRSDLNGYGLVRVICYYVECGFYEPILYYVS